MNPRSPAFLPDRGLRATFDLGNLVQSAGFLYWCDLLRGHWVVSKVDVRFANVTWGASFDRTDPGPVVQRRRQSWSSNVPLIHVQCCGEIANS